MCFFHILGTIHLKLVPIRGIITAAAAAEQEDYLMTVNKKNRSKSVQSGVSINENAIIRRISLIGIVGNVALSAFKLFAGIAGSSGAMVSDFSC